MRKYGRIYRGKPTKKGDVRREVWEVQGRGRRNDRASATKQGGIGEKGLEIYGGLSEGLEMKTYLHCPMDFAKTLQLPFRVGDSDLLEGRKRKYTRSREEEKVDAQMCPFGKATEIRTHIVGETEMYKEERDVLEEDMRGINECDMEEFDTLLIDR